MGRFADQDGIQSWARETVARMVKAGIVQGYAGQFLPLNNSTRAEAAVAISNVLRYLEFVN